MTIDTMRPATEGDLVAINDIYNHYVPRSTCTYQEEPDTLESRRTWLASRSERHPIIVAEIDGRVVGWGSLSTFHSRCAFRRTVEDSVYVHHEFHRRGIGTALLAELIARARVIGHHAIIAAIDAEQHGSVRLHERAGFVRAGELREVGYKFGRWLNVVYMEVLL